jgi:hypothetical protein
MLAKLTAKNQLTLPKAATAAVGAAEYFDVETRNGVILLTPVRIHRADAVRAKLAELSIDETDIGNAVVWARQAPMQMRVAETKAAYKVTTAKPRKPSKKKT